MCKLQSIVRGFSEEVSVLYDKRSAFSYADGLVCKEMADVVRALGCNAVVN